MDKLEGHKVSMIFPTPEAEYAFEAMLQRTSQLLTGVHHLLRGVSEAGALDPQVYAQTSLNLLAGFIEKMMTEVYAEGGLRQIEVDAFAFVHLRKRPGGQG
jgi:hypothetical protein